MDQEEPNHDDVANLAENRIEQDSYGRADSARRELCHVSDGPSVV